MSRVPALWATMAFVGIPVRQFLDAPAAQARLTAVGGLGRHRPRRAGIIERIWPQVADRPGRLNSRYWREDFEEAQAPDFRCCLGRSIDKGTQSRLSRTPDTLAPTIRPRRPSFPPFIYRKKKEERNRKGVV